MDFPQIEHFEALSALPCIEHLFIARAEGVSLEGEKSKLRENFAAVHAKVLATQGLDFGALATAEQVHSDQIKWIQNSPSSPAPGADGLMTQTPGLPLGIYIADCAPVFIVDPQTPAISLVHSGKRGTELNITGKTISRMKEVFGSSPGQMTVFIGPCIHADHYDCDIPGRIITQCHAEGIHQALDSGHCTGCDLKRYFSYRVEKGRTGRMLAVLMLRKTEN